MLSRGRRCPFGEAHSPNFRQWLRQSVRSAGNRRGKSGLCPATGDRLCTRDDRLRSALGSSQGKEYPASRALARGCESGGAWPGAARRVRGVPSRGRKTTREMRISQPRPAASIRAGAGQRSRALSSAHRPGARRGAGDPAGRHSSRLRMSGEGPSQREEVSEN